MANNQLLASDDFSSGSLASGWGAMFGLSTCQVIAGSPKVTEDNVVNVEAGQIWTGLTWPNDQNSEVTVHALATSVGSFITLHVRHQTGSYSGYQANLHDNTAVLYRRDSGAATQLGSTVSGLTFTAGDVWALQAAGACISLYQNGARIAYWYDATYASGYPGYSQFDTNAITNSQVQSWRGYNTIQQDGIWQKQGIVIPANVTDLTPHSGFVFGAYQNSKILYEGSAQLLSGTVYKIWFSSGVLAGGNIYYAESLDGVNWTRSASPVIAGFVNPAVIKNGSTYYLYCQLGTGVTGNVYLYTSTDGIAWTQQSSTVIVPGGGGAWDAGIFLLSPVAIIGGTWYALYTGNTAGTSLYKQGLATSSDGVTWTKYSGNPVLSDAVGSQAIVKVGSTWYAWFLSNQPGQGNSTAPFQDPFDTVRFQSPDLINWTVSAHSVHRSQQFESLNAIEGGCAATAIIDINGQAHLYSISCPSDANAPEIYQTGLAIAPAPIASIVTGNEDAAAQVASDGFTSGLGDLSANWTTPTTGTKLKIVAGNLCEATALSTTCIQFYSGAEFSNDQYSEVTLATLTGGEFLVPIVRCQGGSESWYQANIHGTTGTKSTDCAIYVSVNGVATQIGPFIPLTPQIGDVFRFSVIGNVLSLFQNQFLMLQVQDYANTFASGSPGIAIYTVTALTDVQVSNWAGGNAGVLPQYPAICPPSGGTSEVTVSRIQRRRPSAFIA